MGIGFSFTEVWHHHSLVSFLHIFPRFVGQQHTVRKMVTKVLSWHPDRLGKSAPRHPGPTKSQRSGTHRRSPPHNLLALISRQHEPVEMCPFF